MATAYDIVIDLGVMLPLLLFAVGTLPLGHTLVVYLAAITLNLYQD